MIPIWSLPLTAFLIKLLILLSYITLYSPGGDNIHAILGRGNIKEHFYSCIRHCCLGGRGDPKSTFTCKTASYIAPINIWFQGNIRQTEIANPKQRLRPKQCLESFIFTLNNTKNKNKKTLLFAIRIFKQNSKVIFFSRFL